MLWFASYVSVLETNITMNFVLLFFFWGVVCDRMNKKRSKKAGWIIWGIGMVILMVVFRFVGGYQTIFD